MPGKRQLRTRFVAGVRRGRDGLDRGTVPAIWVHQQDCSSRSRGPGAHRCRCFPEVPGSEAYLQALCQTNQSQAVSVESRTGRCSPIVAGRALRFGWVAPATPIVVVLVVSPAAPTSRLRTLSGLAQSDRHPRRRWGGGLRGSPGDLVCRSYGIHLGTSQTLGLCCTL